MSLLFSFSMKVFMDFFQAFVGDMGVDLCGSDRGMAEHRLDAADVGAVDQKIGREGVAERVRMDVFHDAGFFGVVLDDALDAARSKSQRVTS